jgi:hypothetical protein
MSDRGLKCSLSCPPDGDWFVVLDSKHKKHKSALVASRLGGGSLAKPEAPKQRERPTGSSSASKRRGQFDMALKCLLGWHICRKIGIFGPLCGIGHSITNSIGFDASWNSLDGRVFCWVGNCQIGVGVDHYGLVTGFSTVPSTTPEPCSLVLLGSFLGLGCLLRRRNSQC